MEKAVLDSDTFSEISKGRNASVVAKAEAYLEAYGRYTTSIMTVMEVVKGLQKVRREDRIETILADLALMEVLLVDMDIAVLAGRIYGDLERTGQTVGRMDPFIAATAIHHGFTLVTGNTRHYQRIIDLGYDLTLDDWRETA